MNKRNKVIYWVATLWLALGMGASGVVQLLRLQTEADFMAHLAYPSYLLPLLGGWKVLGVAAVLAPRLPLLKEWAYAGFFFAMSGAVCSHLASGDAPNAVFPSLLLLMLTAVSWYFRPADRKLISLTNSITRRESQG